MRRALAMLPAVLTACAAPAPVAYPVSEPGRPPPTTTEHVVDEVPQGLLLPGFRITNYTLARESDLSGQRTGCAVDPDGVADGCDGVRERRE